MTTEEMLRHRVEHLENVIAAALSILQKCRRDGTPPGELRIICSLLEEALHKPVAEPKEEQAGAGRQTKGLEALVAAARVVTASGGGSVVMVRLREALADLNGTASREPDAPQDHA
jgi:hypothetical protein